MADHTISHLGSVFGWSRVGKSVWDEFYGKRDAVNIGSSGDRTYHMRWHFQNGGLDDKTVYWLDIGHIFLDENGNMKRDLMPDALHPNVEGYRVWAEAMEPTIRKFLGEELPKP